MRHGKIVKIYPFRSIADIVLVNKAAKRIRNHYLHFTLPGEYKTNCYMVGGRIWVGRQQAKLIPERYTQAVVGRIVVMVKARERYVDAEIIVAVAKGILPSEGLRCLVSRFKHPCPQLPQRGLAAGLKEEKERVKLQHTSIYNGGAYLEEIIAYVVIQPCESNVDAEWY